MENRLITPKNMARTVKEAQEKASKIAENKGNSPQEQAIYVVNNEKKNTNSNE